MTAFKPQQHHLTIQGRRFHFASYQDRPANHRRAQLAYPAMWYLVVDGRRCPVLPCDPNQSLLELDAALRDWAEDNGTRPVAGEVEAYPDCGGAARLVAERGQARRLRGGFERPARGEAGRTHEPRGPT